MGFIHAFYYFPQSMEGTTVKRSTLAVSVLLACTAVHADYDAKMEAQAGVAPAGVPASDMAKSNAQMKSMTGKSMQDIQKMTPAEQEAFAKQMEKQYGGAK